MPNASELGRIKAALKQILDAFENQTLLNKLGLAQIRNIKDRTRRGLDLFGRPFRPYTEEWKKRKESVFRVPSHPVNLILDDVTGMLTQIDHVVAADLRSVELMFRTPEKRRIASYHDQLGAGKSRVIRRFWGVSESDEKALGELVRAQLDLILQQLVERV